VSAGKPRVLPLVVQFEGQREDMESLFGEDRVQRPLGISRVLTADPVAQVSSSDRSARARSRISLGTGQAQPSSTAVPGPGSRKATAVQAGSWNKSACSAVSAKRAPTKAISSSVPDFARMCSPRPQNRSDRPTRVPTRPEQ
jgi:hypothetical protein